MSIFWKRQSARFVLVELLVCFSRFLYRKVRIEATSPYTAGGLDDNLVHLVGSVERNPFAVFLSQPDCHLRERWDKDCFEISERIHSDTGRIVLVVAIRILLDKRFQHGVEFVEVLRILDSQASPSSLCGQISHGLQPRRPPLGQAGKSCAESHTACRRVDSVDTCRLGNLSPHSDIALKSSGSA